MAKKKLPLLNTQLTGNKSTVRKYAFYGVNREYYSTGNMKYLSLSFRISLVLHAI
jgi:hypothetical protein